MLVAPSPQLRPALFESAAHVQWSRCCSTSWIQLHFRLGHSINDATITHFGGFDGRVSGILKLKYDTRYMTKCPCYDNDVTASKCKSSKLRHPLLQPIPFLTLMTCPQAQCSRFGKWNLKHRNQGSEKRISDCPELKAARDAGNDLGMNTTHEEMDEHIPNIIADNKTVDMEVTTKAPAAGLDKGNEMQIIEFRVSILIPFRIVVQLETAQPSSRGLAQYSVANGFGSGDET